MGDGKTLLKRHSLLLYFALAFILSWGGILILVGTTDLGIPERLNEMSVYIMMLIGPSVAGILLIGLVSGRAGFRELLSRLTKWRVDARWYAVAFLTAPILVTAILFSLSLFSSEFLPVIFTTGDIGTTLVNGIVAGIMVGFFEELGWTGFAIPRLRQRYGILTTGLIVGFLWGLWHFILFWERGSFSGGLSLVLLLVQLFSWLPAYRILMVWVYDRTGSLLVVMLMHLSLVAIQSIFIPPLTGGALLAYILTWAVVLWVVVAIIAVINRGKLSRQSLPKQVA
jgi:membrane protease YdiL (CAAX protease family)